MFFFCLNVQHIAVANDVKEIVIENYRVKSLSAEIKETNRPRGDCKFFNGIPVAGKPY